MKVWFIHAQKPAEIIDVNDSVDEMELEELEPMLSERIEKWSKELVDRGRAEGLIEGELKGKAEGKAEEIQKVAKKMLQKGMSVVEISEITGLSESDILSLCDPNTH